MEKKKNMFQVAGNILSKLKYVLVFMMMEKYFWNINLFPVICILDLKMASGPSGPSGPSGWNLSTQKCVIALHK